LSDISEKEISGLASVEAVAREITANGGVAEVAHSQLLSATIGALAGTLIARLTGS